MKAVNEAERGHLEVLDNIVEDVVPFAYRIPLLHSEVCDKLMSEVNHYLEFSSEHEEELKTAGGLSRLVQYRQLRLSSALVIRISYLQKTLSSGRHETSSFGRCIARQSDEGCGSSFVPHVGGLPVRLPVRLRR